MDVTDQEGNVSIRSSKYGGGGLNRGLVFLDGDKLILEEFPHCRTLDGPEDLKMISGKNVWYYPSLEGTIIRVFYADGSWFTSTTRKLDAFKSIWVQRREPLASNINKILHLECDGVVDCKRLSYGERFAKAVLASNPEYRCLNDLYDAKFDRAHKYVFLLRSSADDRVVCRAPDDDDEAIVNLLMVVDENNRHVVNGTVDGFTTHMMYALESDDDVDTAVKMFSNELDANLVQGLHVYDAEKHLSYKLYLPAHSLLRGIRNNERSLTERYLQLRVDAEQEQGKLMTFFNLFPEMRAVAYVLEEGIYHLCSELCRVYYMRYVEKQYIDTKTYGRRFVHALYVIHGDYIATRTQTTPTKIGNLMTIRPSELHDLLKEFYYIE